MIRPVILLLALAGVALADPAIDRAKAACTPDALRLCASAIPDIARIRVCLRENAAHLSADCRAALAALRKPGAAPMAAAIGGAYYVARPPAQFDHTFRGPTTIRYLSLDQLARLCGGPALGCTAIGGPRCDINIARIGQDAELIRHERAHCNGWPAWHPALAPIVTARRLP